MDLDSEEDSDEVDVKKEKYDEGAGVEKDGEEEETADGEVEKARAVAFAMVVTLQRMFGNDALSKLTKMAQKVADGKISLDDFQVPVIEMIFL